MARIHNLLVVDPDWMYLALISACIFSVFWHLFWILRDWEARREEMQREIGR
jgi:hypothetical protein